MIAEHPTPTYVEVICEIQWNPTEPRENLETILKQFLQGPIQIDERFEGKFLFVRNNKPEALQLFGEWVREAQLLDTVRKQLIGSMVGNITALYFNRQAAFMKRLSLIDVDDKPPLGPVMLQIVSDSLFHVIDELTPRTYKGKTRTREEWERIRAKEYRRKRRRD